MTLFKSIMLVAVFLVCDRVQAATEISDVVELPPQFSSSLTEKYSKFVHDEKGSEDLRSAMLKAESRYNTALKALGNRMALCGGKVDSTRNWTQRIQKKLSKAKIKNLKKDIRTAIGSRWFILYRECVKTEESNALYSEFEFLPFADAYRDSLKTFAEHVSENEKKELQPTLDWISKQNANPTPLQALLDHSQALRVLERTNEIDPVILSFVKNDKSFQKAFSLNAAMQNFTSLINGLSETD